jgi:arylsulfatase B
VLLFVNDLGYGELGCQGNLQVPTTHVDALAVGGVCCTAGYVTAPYCAASRWASM